MSVETIEGQCLCGAVQITAKVDNPKVRACHCDMCRQHNSGAFFSIETLPDSIVVTGPATTFKSSEWGGRGFSRHVDQRFGTVLMKINRPTCLLDYFRMQVAAS